MSPRDDHAPFLERLSQRLEDVPIELRELVEEEHTGMRQAHLARRETGAAPHECGVRSGVVRCTKRTPAPQPVARAEQARHTGDHRRLERFALVERGQQPRNRPRQERLAGTGRTDQQQAVPTGKRDLQPPARGGLPADVGEVDRWVPADQRPAYRMLVEGPRDGHEPAAGRLRRTSTVWAGNQPRGIIEAEQRFDLEPLDERRLGRVGRRYPHAARAGPGERVQHRQNARHRMHGTREREFPQQSPVPSGGRHLPRGDEDAHGDRDVIGGAVFAPTRGREVDRDALLGVDEPTVADRPAHPFASLRERRVRQADDLADRQAWRHVDLDADQGALEPVHHRCDQRREHAAERTAGPSTDASSPLTAACTAHAPPLISRSTSPLDAPRGYASAPARRCARRPRPRPRTEGCVAAASTARGGRAQVVAGARSAASARPTSRRAACRTKSTTDLPSALSLRATTNGAPVLRAVIATR